MEIDIKSFQRALAQVAQDRGISPEKIIETLEAAIATAYKKDYGKKGQKIKAKFNPITGDVKFWQVKLVVDKDMLYSEEEIEKLKERIQYLTEERDGPGCTPQLACPVLDTGKDEPGRRNQVQAG